MRLIDAEYLLYGLGMFSEKENGAEFIKGVDAVADMIESAETISPAANWTPCSVALPEEHKTVLVTVADEYGNDVMFAWHDSAGWQSGYEENLPILAWMPAPEPYRGEA